MVIENFSGIYSVHRETDSKVGVIFIYQRVYYEDERLVDFYGNQEHIAYLFLIDEVH
jgi:hypothetical protein